VLRIERKNHERKNNRLFVFHRMRDCVRWDWCDVGLEGITMNIKFLTHVRRIFANYDAPPATIRSYQRQWVRSVRQLGNKWLMAKQIEKVTQ
jgi:hypothetical protein